ncbi:MAG: Nif3-like dinuclear metal center hexameric protein [Solirubrobacterales bacterium]
MARLDEIVAWLDDLLEPQAFVDYCPNGLQVPGAQEVRRVATGVSAGLELFERAGGSEADLVLVHHGLFWGSGPQAIDTLTYGRLKLLIDRGMALASYHLPLDAHPQVGNNALLAEALGATSSEPFALHEGRPIGTVACFDPGIGRDELVARAAAATGGRGPLVFPAGPDLVERVGIVSGAGSSYLPDAIAAGLDGFVTGEPAERVMNEATEAGITFVAAGHYATETFGVRRLGELLAERFGVGHEFIDVPNPI